MTDESGETLTLADDAALDDADRSRISDRLGKLEQTTAQHEVRITFFEAGFDGHLKHTLVEQEQFAKNTEEMRRLIQSLREELLELKALRREDEKLRGTISLKTIAQIIGMLVGLIAIAGTVAKIALP